MSGGKPSLATRLRAAMTPVPMNKVPEGWVSPSTRPGSTFDTRIYWTRIAVTTVAYIALSAVGELAGWENWAWTFMPFWPALLTGFIYEFGAELRKKRARSVSPPRTP